MLFAELVADGDTLPAVRAIGAIATFSGRLEMLNAAAEAHFLAYPNEELHAEIKQVNAEALKFSARRNEIAHGFVGGWRPEGAPKSEHGYVLRPFPHTFRKSKFDPLGEPPNTLVKRPPIRPEYLYTSAEINAFRVHFERLTQRAVHLPTKVFYQRRNAQKAAAGPPR